MGQGEDVGEQWVRSRVYGRCSAWRCWALGPCKADGYPRQGPEVQGEGLSGECVE